MKGKRPPLSGDSGSDAGRDSAAEGITQTTHHRHHRQLILQAVHGRTDAHTGRTGSDGHRQCDRRKTRSTQNGHIDGAADAVGRRQSGGSLLNQAQVASTEGLGTGAAGVGVGSAVNRLQDELAMVAVVRGLHDALGSAVATRV